MSLEYAMRFWISSQYTVKSDFRWRVNMAFLMTVKSKLPSVSACSPSLPFSRSAMTQCPSSIASRIEKVDCGWPMM